MNPPEETERLPRQLSTCIGVVKYSKTKFKSSPYFVRKDQYRLSRFRIARACTEHLSYHCDVICYINAKGFIHRQLTFAMIATLWMAFIAIHDIVGRIFWNDTESKRWGSKLSFLFSGTISLTPDGEDIHWRLPKPHSNQRVPENSVKERSLGVVRW